MGITFSKQSKVLVLGLTAFSARQGSADVEETVPNDVVELQPFTRNEAVERNFHDGNLWSDIEDNWSDTDDELERPPLNPEVGAGKTSLVKVMERVLEVDPMSEVEINDGESDLVKLIGKHNKMFSRHGVSGRRLKKGGGTDGDSPAYSGPESEANGKSAPSASDGDSGDFDFSSNMDVEELETPYVGPQNFPKRSDRVEFFRRLRNVQKKPVPDASWKHSKFYKLMASKNTVGQDD